MIKKRSIVWVLALLIVFALALTACSREDEEYTAPPLADDTADEPPAETPPPVDIADVYIPDEAGDAIDALEQLRELEGMFPIAVSNQDPIIPGGTFYWARAQSSPFPGIFHTHLNGDAADQVIAQILTYNLISINDDMEMTNEGPVRWVKCLDELSFTMTLVETIYWSDGVELTLGDLYYAFWFISHPDYEGVRFDSENGTVFVVGAPEFKAGEVDYIAGLVLSEDERELKVYFTEIPPSMLFSGGILNTPLPRHHFEGIPVGDTRGHMNARDNMLGFGPFILDTIVPGESVLLRANENYWQGRPYLDYIYYHIIPPAMQAEFMRAGMYDMGGMRHIDWEDYGGENTNNVEFVGRIGGSQSFIYFTLGAQRRDEETGRVYFVPRYDNHPITNRYFRHAVGYALDHHTLNMTIRNGLQRNATTVLHPFNTGRWINPYSLGFGEWDLDRANEILDQAGFEMGPDGFRLDLDGNPFVVNLGWRIAPPNDEIIFNHYQENMHAIGIDFRLWDDALIDHGFLVTRNITGDESFELSPNDDMHMWQMSWNMGANPNPFTLWGHAATFNLSNFTNDTFESILADIASTEAWDPDFLEDAYRRWAEAFDYYLPAIYETWPIIITTLNRRVANFTLSRRTFYPESSSWHRIGLTALEPYVHQ